MPSACPLDPAVCLLGSPFPLQEAGFKGEVALRACARGQRSKDSPFWGINCCLVAQGLRRHEFGVNTAKLQDVSATTACWYTSHVPKEDWFTSPMCLLRPLVTLVLSVSSDWTMVLGGATGRSHLAAFVLTSGEAASRLGAEPPLGDQAWAGNRLAWAAHVGRAHLAGGPVAGACGPVGLLAASSVQTFPPWSPCWHRATEPERSVAASRIGAALRDEGRGGAPGTRAEAHAAGRRATRGQERGRGVRAHART